MKLKENLPPEFFYPIKKKWIKKKDNEWIEFDKKNNQHHVSYWISHKTKDIIEVPAEFLLDSPIGVTLYDISNEEVKLIKEFNLQKDKN